MSSELAQDLGALEEALFPIQPRWDTPPRPWHSSYPEGVPPALEYPALRTEQLLLCAFEQFPDQIALRYFGANWSYSELVARVKQVAANLRSIGINTGDRVMMVLPNTPEYVVAWFALHWLGAEIVPANPLLPAKDLIELAETANITAVMGLDLRLKSVIEMTRGYSVPILIVTSLAGHLPFYLSLPYRLKCRLDGKRRVAKRTAVYSFDALYRPVSTPIQEPLVTDPSLPAVLQPTGGTTGTPKIAVLSHSNLQANVAQLHAWCGLKAGQEVVLAVLPFFHVFGSTVVLLSAIAGGATLLLQVRFDPNRVWKVMERWRPGVAPMVPFMFASLCEQMKRRGRNIEGLRFCFSGASPLSVELKKEFQQRTGATIFEGYGLSEASPVTHTNPPNDTAKAGSIGVPMPNTEVRIVDTETGNVELAEGEIGELVVRGPQVMSGYLNNSEETAQMLRDGWLHTGDLAQMDENGFFTIVDRKKDMIISGGLNVYPNEVEQVLAAHPNVQECAVVGLPDRMYGEKVVAFVVPVAGTRIVAAKLQKHCASQLAKYKVPKEIEIRDELPKNFLGKVRRIELRSKAA